MTSTILFSSPVSHHLSSPHKFPDPFRNDCEISIDKSQNEIFSRTLNSIIRNNQIEKINSRDSTIIVDVIEKSPMSSDVSTHSNEKYSPESSQVSTSTNEQTSNDSNSEQFNNSVSSTSSINNSQIVNKLHKSKKKVQFISNENLTNSADDESAESLLTNSPNSIIKPPPPSTTIHSQPILKENSSANNSTDRLSNRTTIKSQSIFNPHSNSFVTSMNTNRNSMTNFGTNYNSFRMADSRFNSYVHPQNKATSFNNNRYSTSYTPNYNFRFDNRYRHNSLRAYPEARSMKSSMTMPAISSSNDAPAKPYSTSFSSYVISDTDNPFRPEGELAKEADEFVHQLKVKAEQEVADIINTKTSSSDIRVETTIEEETIAAKVAPKSPTKSEQTKLLSSDNAINVVVVNEQKQSESPTKQVADNNTPAPATTTAPSSNGIDKPKKQKTKSKCGCSIS